MHAFLSVHSTGGEPATREWWAAELPASGGFGNARSVARIHAALACGGTLSGVRLLSEAGARRPRRPPRHPDHPGGPRQPVGTWPDGRAQAGERKPAWASLRHIRVKQYVA